MDRQKNSDINCRSFGSTSWRGLGGHTITEESVKFDQQLDKISVWLENWCHVTRCQVLEVLLSRSGYTQFQFIWTVMQPTMHRDFLLSAKKEFPQQCFTPLSTHNSREIKKRQYRQSNIHRIASAHVRNYNHVTQLMAGDSNNASCLDPAPEGLRTTTKDDDVTHLVALRDRFTVSANSSNRLLHGNGNSVAHQRTLSSRALSTQSLPLAPRPRVRRSLRAVTALPRVKSSKSQLLDNNYLNKALATAPALRHIEMPVRRHVQDEMSPRIATNLRSSFAEIMAAKENTRATSVVQRKIPSEGWQLIYWYTDCWTDSQRNEFLHKAVLKLDPRQHYFLSSYLAVKRYKDFIAQLPEGLALRILGYLKPKDLVRCSRVSHVWNVRCNNNDLWRIKCGEVNMEIPVRSTKPKWKKMFRENLYIRQNWARGRYKTLEFRGHTDKVLCVIFNHYTMATGSMDHTIIIWEIKTCRSLHVLQGHTKGVWCLRFFSKTTLISGGYDCTLRIWNTREGICTRVINAHEGPIWAFCIHANTLASVSQDKTAKLWDVARSTQLHVFSGHTAAVFCVDMAESGSLVVSGSADRSVRLWSAKTGDVIRVLWLNASSSVMAVGYHREFLVCAYGQVMHLYVIQEKPKLLRVWGEHEKRIETVQLRVKDKDRLEGSVVSAGQDGMVKYWSLNKKESVQTFHSHHKRVNCIHFDEVRIASASYDNKIKILDFNVDDETLKEFDKKQQLSPTAATSSD